MIEFRVRGTAVSVVVRVGNNKDSFASVQGTNFSRL